MAKVVLIRPASVTTLSGMGDDAVPPVGIAYLAAAMEREGHATTVIDACGEALGRYTPIDFIPDALRHGLLDEEIIARIPAGTEIIGISCMFSLEWLTTKRLAEGIKAAFPSAFIVAGGEHITAMPQYVLAECGA